MDDTKNTLMNTLERAAAKLQTLEAEQDDIDQEIAQTKNEIQKLEKAIASFRELDGCLIQD